MALANRYFCGKTVDFGSVALGQNGSKYQKTLIPLHFSNPKLHNKLLARQHPSMG
jgi:hypothetical protein